MKVKVPQFPLPRINKMIQEVAAHEFFITIDLTSAYYQIPLHHRSRKLTAFRSDGVLYEFCVLPFKIFCAPALFQEILLRYYCRKIVINVFTSLFISLVIYIICFQHCWLWSLGLK